MTATIVNFSLLFREPVSTSQIRGPAKANSLMRIERVLPKLPESCSKGEIWHRFVQWFHLTLTMRVIWRLEYSIPLTQDPMASQVRVLLNETVSKTEFIRIDKCLTHPRRQCSIISGVCSTKKRFSERIFLNRSYQRNMKGMWMIQHPVCGMTGLSCKWLNWWK